jgi:basic membrane protein A
MNSIFKKVLASSAVIATVVFGATAADAAALKVAAISGYFSQGFGISIVNGLDKAKKDLGIELKIVDTGNRALDYEEQFNNLAKDGQYDVIFVMGWELVDALQKSHTAYPKQRFVFIDGVLDSPTMTYVDFVEEEGSFLAGALSGMLTAEKVDGFADSSQVGFIGGRDIPVIHNFLMGMEQGVANVSKDVKVSSVFAGTFDDPAKGSEVAMAMYGQDVDIIYQAAGPTGEGVLQAAKAANKYAIGVDIDQCATAPGNILASMMKRGDIAVYNMIKGQVSGSDPIKDGSVSFGIKSGGVELKVCDQVKDKIPADVASKLEDLRKGIADGSIPVALNK